MTRGEATDEQFPTRRIAARRVRFDFSTVPRHWADGRPFVTAYLNALHLLFPPGEHWFARCCRQALSRVDDPRLRADVQGFMGQESSHGIAHESFFATLEAQGYPARRATHWVARAVQRFERKAPPSLQLAAIAGAEQYTAALGDWAFRSGVFDRAHPVMRDLFLWHAAEECEHKSVAFDLLAATEPGRFVLRSIGFTLASVLLFLFWGVLTAVLLRADRTTSRRAQCADLLRALRSGELPLGACARAFWIYWKPGFHPRQEGDDAPAQAFLARFAPVPREALSESI